MTAPPIWTLFRLYDGATFSTEPIVVNNPDGTPVDLTGWTGRMTIWREDASPDDPLYVLGNAAGETGLVIDGPNGSITASVAASDVNNQIDEDGELWPFRLVLTNPNATPEYVERLVQGYVVAQP